MLERSGIWYVLETKFYRNSVKNRIYIYLWQRGLDTDSSVYHQWWPIHLSTHRFQFSSTWVRMQMWTCQSNPSSLPWPWEPVLVVSLYFYPVRVIKYKQSMRPLGLGLKTHLPYSHWGPHSLSLLKGVDLYWWLLPEGDISCSMWQPHFVQRCHSPGRSGCAFCGSSPRPCKLASFRLYRTPAAGPSAHCGSVGLGRTQRERESEGCHSVSV